MSFPFLRSVVFTAICGVVAMASREARAQSNYRLNPVGGRSQLLGGTGMAYGRDATAAFLNPGTAVLVDDSRLSFSVNFYALTYTHKPRWFQPGEIDQSKFGDLTINAPSQNNLEFNALPSSLCFFFRAGQVDFLRAKSDPMLRDARIGLCFAQIYDESTSNSADGFNSVNGLATTRQAQTVSQKFTRFAAGPTYAMYINNAFSIGASVHLTLSSHRNLMEGTAATSGSTPTAITSAFYDSSRGDAFGVEATIGSTLRFGKQTIGLSIKSPSVHIYGVGGVNEQTHFEGAGNSSNQVIAEGSFVSRSPLRISAGSGVEGKWGQFEFNTSFSAPMGQAFSAELTGTQTASSPNSFSDHPIGLSLSEPSRGVMNFGTGIEVFMSPKVSTLMGFATDFSAVKSGTLLQQGLFNYYPARTSRISGSFGISSHGPGGELMVGGELSGGWGERIAVNQYQLPPTLGTTGQAIYQVMFVIAGSTSLRNIQRAVKDVQKVVNEPSRLAPSTTPTRQEPTMNTTPQTPLLGPGSDEQPKKEAPKKP